MRLDGPQKREPSQEARIRVDASRAEPRRRSSLARLHGTWRADRRARLRSASNKPTNYRPCKVARVPSVQGAVQRVPPPGAAARARSRPRSCRRAAAPPRARSRAPRPRPRPTASRRPTAPPCSSWTWRSATAPGEPRSPAARAPLPALTPAPPQPAARAPVGLRHAGPRRGRGARPAGRRAHAGPRAARRQVRHAEQAVQDAGEQRLLLRPARRRGTRHAHRYVRASLSQYYILHSILLIL